MKWNSVFTPILVLLLSSVINIWALGTLPFDQLPISQYWQVLAYRALSAIFSLIMIKIFAPQALTRLTLHIPVYRWGLVIGVVTFLTLPSLIHSPIGSVSISQIIAGIGFTLFIGLDEELFSRGLIFGVFEKFGTGLAVTVSSLHFGLLHLTNIFWGGQSWSYTSSQIISAMAFGYLATGLMIFTGSIWIPILLHALTDLPSQFDSAPQYSHMVSGNANWVATLLFSLFYCGIGSLLLFRDSESAKRKFFRAMTKFGLVEQPKISRFPEGVEARPGQSVA